MTKKAGYTFIELVVGLSIVTILIGLAVSSVGNSGDRRCVHDTLKIWGSSIKEARAHAIQFNSTVWVRVAEGGRADLVNTPHISAIRDTHKSSWTPNLRYEQVLGSDLDQQTGAVRRPVRAACGSIAEDHLRLIELGDLPRAPNELVTDWNVTINAFNNNIFGILPNGSVVDTNGNNVSGIFWFTFQRANIGRFYGAVYVGAAGENELFIYDANIDEWGLLE
jgi:prepilin-type N-terminal cleavage/methylation domain-containing protein